MNLDPKFQAVLDRGINLTLNEELSKKIATDYSDLIKPFESYSNIGRLLTNSDFMSTYGNERLEVLIGTVSVSTDRGVYRVLKNCFLIINGSLVDPSSVKENRFPDSISKYCFVKFIYPEEYIGLVKENNHLDAKEFAEFIEKDINYDIIGKFGVDLLFSLAE